MTAGARLLSVWRGSGAAVALTIAVIVPGCSSEGGSGDSDRRRDDDGGSALVAAPCGDDIEEPIDPGSSRHALPGSPEPSYLSDPPTSGPHQLGAHPSGNVDQPISRPVQVAILEGGGVLIQYREAGHRAMLAPLARADVTVAPNPDLPGAVVATAWLHKLVCSGVNVDALQGFIDAHAGEGTNLH